MPVSSRIASLAFPDGAMRHRNDRFCMAASAVDATRRIGARLQVPPDI
jgi:hypothetical protein